MTPWPNWFSRTARWPASGCSRAYIAVEPARKNREKNEGVARNEENRPRSSEAGACTIGHGMTPPLVHSKATGRAGGNPGHCHHPSLLDDAPGTYVLILASSSKRRIRIGRLGVMALHAGYYAYAGSAFGPGGLRSRLAHHTRPCTTPHWHIDYLRKVASPAEVWYSCDHRAWEHHWAATLRSLSGSSVPLPRFGATDCGCTSHLFFFEAMPSFDDFRRRIDVTTLSPPSLGRVSVSGSPVR